MESQYSRRLEKIEALLQAKLPEKPGSSWIGDSFGDLCSPVSFGLVQTLTMPGWDLLNRGGKRWRPLLMTLVCESLGGGDAAMPLVPLVEFPHNASLIHDDIEDNSDERRGRPAVHITYGIDTAINSGCFLYFLPLAFLDSWDAPAERKYRVFSIWGTYMRRLHLGQAMDISWHRDFTSLPGLDAYDRMCRLKTGCLARLAAVLGVEAAGGNATGMERLAESLGEAAENLGVGFQILDDVKNLTAGVPGKKRGDDIVEGKKSLPVLLYLHKKGDAALVSRCFAAARQKGPGAPEVEELISALEAAGVLEEARSRALTLIAGARGAFSGFAPPAGSGGSLEAQRLLAGLADLLI